MFHFVTTDAMFSPLSHREKGRLVCHSSRRQTNDAVDRINGRSQYNHQPTLIAYLIRVVREDLKMCNIDTP